MKELELKYGCNPNQKPSRIYMENGELPIQVLNGKPGYINFLDAFNGWQLVSELKKATDFRQLHLLSMYHRPVLQWDFHSAMWSVRFTGLTIWIWSLHRLQMHMREQEAQTVCHLLVILFLYLMSVIRQLQ